MAEYLPLLERAVAGLGDSNPETRRAIYERARSALLGQLRRMEPPVPEEDIARESDALDEAISRIEASLEPPQSASPAEAAAVQPAAPETPPSRPARTAPRASRSAAVPAPRSSGITTPAGSASAPASGVAPPPARERPVLAARPPAPIVASTLRAPAPSESPEKPPAAPSRPLRSARPLNTAPRVGLEPRVAPPSSDLAATGSPDLPTPRPVDEPPTVSLPIAPRVAAPAAAPPIVHPHELVAPSEEAELPASDPDPLEESPAAASPARRRAPALYLAAAVGALLVAGVAVEAWRLRDRPQDVTADQQQASAASGAKMVERAAGDTNPGSDAQDTTSGTAVVPAPVGTGAQAPAPAAAHTPAPDRGGQASSSDAGVAAPPAPAPTTTEQSSTPSLGVAERAALLLDAPQEPQKIKTYVGSVVWKNQNVSAGQGQPLSEAVVADVDIPDAKMTMSMVMKRNTEPQFPASHTIEFRFTPQAGSDIGAVKQISVPDLRVDDNSPIGEPLTGLPVAITDNYFLVGLSRGDAEGANIKMLEKRNWFDVSLLLVSGKAAKITFEKGVPGQRVIDDALKSWQSGG